MGKITSLLLALVASASVAVGAPDCKDVVSALTCVKSVRIGHCTSKYYQDYMKRNCAKSCFFCTPSTVPELDECADTYPDTCPQLTHQCQSVYRPWMKVHCKKACGFCGRPTQPPTTQTPPPTCPLTRPRRTLPSQSACGVPQVQMSRVIAGTNARKGAWPWQILMLKRGRPSCGGTLISNNWVVTAAHCVYGRDLRYPHRFTVRVGEHDRNVQEGTEVDMQVEKVISHPRYSRRTLDYDIALFKLSKPVQFNKFVQPACLPTQQLAPGTECFITGWGKIRHPGSMHTYLQQARMPVVSNDVCYAKNKKIIPLPITSRMICGGEGGVNSISGCHGDSGGPYVCHVDGRWELHGDVSHGSPRCKSTETYTVFARTMFFKSWIEQNIMYN